MRSNRQNAVAENLGSSRYEQKKRGHFVIVTSFIKLLNQDSNPDRQNQNL